MTSWKNPCNNQSIGSVYGGLPVGEIALQLYSIFLVKTTKKHNQWILTPLICGIAQRIPPDVSFHAAQYGLQRENKSSINILFK